MLPNLAARKYAFVQYWPRNKRLHRYAVKNSALSGVEDNREKFSGVVNRGAGIPRL